MIENKELMDLLSERRTYRRFDESRKIPDEVISDMKYSAQLSSSAMNRQPLKYIYVRTAEIVNNIFDITSWGGAIPNGEGRPKVGERPNMFVVVLEDKSLQSKFTSLDVGLSISNMTLCAMNHGVGSCIIGSVNCEKLREMINIPDDYDVNVIVAFGYPAHKSRIVEMQDSNSIKYFLDDDKNYVVPKRKIDDVNEEM